MPTQPNPVSLSSHFLCVHVLLFLFLFLFALCTNPSTHNPEYATNIRYMYTRTTTVSLKASAPLQTPRSQPGRAYIIIGLLRLAALTKAKKKKLTFFAPWQTASTP
ncbi:hypothetical protein V8C37DRAFT_365534 [Trichoderma ceciliae]